MNTKLAKLYKKIGDPKESDLMRCGDIESGMYFDFPDALVNTFLLKPKFRFKTWKVVFPYEEAQNKLKNKYYCVKEPNCCPAMEPFPFCFDMLFDNRLWKFRMKK